MGILARLKKHGDASRKSPAVVVVEPRCERRSTNYTGPISDGC